MEAAIVILNYNGKEMLERFLPNVLNYSIFPVIIADNASSDDSVDFLKKSYPELRVLNIGQNLGYAGGYNKALDQLKGQFDYFILLNSDVEVSPNWDTILVDFLKQHPDTAAVQPKILSLQNEGYFDYAGACGGFLDSLGYPYCRGRILNTIEKDEGQYDQSIEVDWASGACLGVRAEFFEELGGFRAEFFAHMEEIDFCWRLRKRGRKLYCVPESKVFHLGGGTLSKANSYKTYLNFRNSILMLYLNLEMRGFREVFWKRLPLDMAAGMHLLLSQGPAHSKAVFNAYSDFFKMRRRMSKDSLLAPKLVKGCSDRSVLSIILTYYFQGKKKFSQLRSVK
ncbi:glycosyltransferase family 2 protein [Litoribacter ruber]|uniref:glycosyltransferase family 2 protein n=1 Tax=Litoribacter ruber TaxID=702568 RepID=UPI001BDA4A70|nr:glycosyltransferase family 2 protein [Litoribacter ruber]MBT0812635.1 glycosyltransferase family 2 protein [Litoribacter ruber]